jgi:hypothetical protein
MSIATLFSTLSKAEIVPWLYRSEYNNHRSHSSFGDHAPTEFRLGQTKNDDPNDASKQVA